MTEQLIDIKGIQDHLAQVVNHYEISAPTVSRWADDLYIRMNEDFESVRVCELSNAIMLLENDTWEQPNLAANRIYHLMDRLKQDVTGQIGY